MINNRINNHWLAICLLTAMVVLAVGMRYQGWQSRTILNQDDLPYLQAVQAFRQSFTVMDHGDLSSYGSYSPPGALLEAGAFRVKSASMVNMHSR